MNQDVVQNNKKKDENKAQENDFVRDLMYQNLDKKSRKFGRESLNNDAFVTLVNPQDDEIYAFIPKEYASLLATALCLKEQDQSKK
ncbi:hypothetical protein CN918_30400 [Priestia megaterium]|nr:hypothetical protein CN918_30400 [Priestia megaterium]